MKEDSVYLAHIRDAAERIRAYTVGGREDFLSDSMIHDAVLRNLEVIGQAVKCLTAELRLANADVPWKQIAGMRDVLIHNYFGVKLDTVWQVVVGDLPTLEARVRQLLGDQNR